MYLPNRSALANSQSSAGQGPIITFHWPPLDTTGAVVQFFLMLDLLRVPAKILCNGNYKKRGSLLKAEVPYHIKTPAGMH